MWCSQYFRDTQALFLVAHRVDDRNILAYLPLKHLELDFVCMNLHGGFEDLGRMTLLETLVLRL
jgi:hypothetical protein